jgi:hypothetical protein
MLVHVSFLPSLHCKSQVLEVARTLALNVCLCLVVLHEVTAPPKMAVWGEWVRQFKAFGQLPAKRLRNRKVWEHTVRHQLLPPVLALAAEAAAALEGDSLQARRQEAAAAERVAAAVALRQCAFLGCINLRGCSEGRLRGQRCGGCGAVRYCSRECQLADWGQHFKVCRHGQGR